MELAQAIAKSKELGFSGLDIPWMLEQWVSKSPDKVMMAWEPFSGDARSWTYQQFAKEARRFARGLADRRVSTGDFVIIHLDNTDF